MVFKAVFCVQYFLPLCFALWNLPSELVLIIRDLKKFIITTPTYTI